MKRLTANCLNERITFLKRVVRQTPEGDYQETWKEIGQFWAMIKPMSVSIREQKNAWDVMDIQKMKGLYFLAMRKNIDRNALHADLSAISWNHKILDILIPFRLSSSKNFLEAIFVDRGKEKKDE